MDNALKNGTEFVVSTCRIAPPVIKNSVLAAELEDWVLGAVTIDLERFCPKHSVNAGHQLRLHGTAPVYSCRIAPTLLKNSVLAAELEDWVLGAVTIDLERLCPKHLSMLGINFVSVVQGLYIAAGLLQPFSKTVFLPPNWKIGCWVRSLSTWNTSVQSICQCWASTSSPWYRACI
jgi:hypothetical protein